MVPPIPRDTKKAPRVRESHAEAALAGLSSPITSDENLIPSVTAPREPHNVPP